MIKTRTVDFESGDGIVEFSLDTEILKIKIEANQSFEFSIYCTLHEAAELHATLGAMLDEAQSNMENDDQER